MRDDSPAVRFRRYDPRDQAAVLALHEWAMEAAGTTPSDIPGTADLQAIEREYFAGGDFVVGLLAEGPTLPETFDGQIVAMGGFLPSEDGHEDERTVADAAELHRMRVAPTHQRRGIGRQLLTELEGRIREAGFESTLATTARRQEGAVAFYPSAGYREVDRSTYGEYDLVHYEKSLAADQSPD